MKLIFAADDMRPAAVYNRRAFKAQQTMRARYPERYIPENADARYWQGKAHRFVQSAIEKGLLPSLASGEYACVDCGDAADRYEHRDYSRPLDVEPVCIICNRARGLATYPVAANYQFNKR